MGLRPTPRLGRLRGPDAPRRSLAGARCAPPFCGNEHRSLVRSRITVQGLGTRVRARGQIPNVVYIRGLTLSSPLDRARDIATRARAEGGRALIVGGWVRDRLIGRGSKDIDIEVFGLPAERLRAMLESLGRVETVGESFQVYKSGDIDVSLPRHESKSGRGHRGFDVSGDPSMTMAEAARRRDFTVNAIAWDPLVDEYLDPFDGRGDLERRVLRVVDPATFADDSLRVLRGIQFAARFDFTLDDEARDLCRAISLDDLPPERVWGEFEKLLSAPRPSIGFALAFDLGVVEQLHPELHALAGCPQEPEWHPEGDVWVHTLQVIDQARTRVDDLPRPQRLAMMLGAVCHDFGKPSTTAFLDGRTRSIDHEEQGVAPATRFPGRLAAESSWPTSTPGWIRHTRLS